MDLKKKRYYRLGSNPEKLFSFDVMLNELKKFGKYGAAAGPIYIAIQTANTETMPDITTEIKFDFNDISFEERIRDLIVDLVKFGYI